MQIKIQAPTKFQATIKLPSSKSISNRALIIDALAKCASFPDNISDCDDTQVIVNAIREMPDMIDIKAAGTAMRFLTAYLSVTPGEHTITGTDRMKHRPIGILVNALRHLGAEINYLEEEGFPPLRIKGGDHKGGEIELSGAVSSQYISALLMIGPTLRNGLRLKLTGDIISKPYIDLTLCTMREFGAKAEWSDINTISVKPHPYCQRDYLIESDWSASSYWYEMIALCNDEEAEINLPGLMDASRQGDSAAKYLFSLLGIKSKFSTTTRNIPATVTLKRKGKAVSRLNYDFINQPDLAQTFVVCCSLMEIPFRFTGLHSLKIKETDRMEALKKEMKKLGYVIEIEGDSIMSWNGEHCEPEPEIAIDTYEDHRMAMAFAPASFKLPYVLINDPLVVSKSYPYFWEDMRKAGFTITETE
jgi:3-phosphoshikimate 1-carboxyvinyltransferase